MKDSTKDLLISSVIANLVKYPGDHEKAYRDAVQKDGRALKFIPNKRHTEILATLAVKNNPKAAKYVSKKIRDRLPADYFESLSKPAEENPSGATNRLICLSSRDSRKLRDFEKWAGLEPLGSKSVNSGSTNDGFLNACDTIINKHWGDSDPKRTKARRAVVLF